jgi:hypothetical protein
MQEERYGYDVNSTLPPNLCSCLSPSLPSYLLVRCSVVVVVFYLTHPHTNRAIGNQRTLLTFACLPPTRSSFLLQLDRKPPSTRHFSREMMHCGPAKVPPASVHNCFLGRYECLEDSTVRTLVYVRSTIAPSWFWGRGGEGSISWTEKSETCHYDRCQLI